MMRWRGFLPLALFVGLALLLGVGLTLRPREVPSPFIGKPAPAFSLPLLDDPQRQWTPTEARGQVWLLNVWASWCGPCRDEHPTLMGLARDTGIAIYGLNYKDDPRNAQEWLLKLGNPYRASLTDRSGTVGIDYGVYGVPETFVIDRGGVIRLKHVGPITPEIWQRDILPLVRRLQG